MGGDVLRIGEADPVARKDPDERGPTLAEELDRRAVAVLGHDLPRAVLHDVVGEHAEVVARGLDEHDVHVGVLAPVALHAVCHAAVEHDPQSLVEHVRHPALAEVAAERAVGRGRVVQDGDEGVDADDEVGPVVDRELDVRGLLDPAIHVVAAVDAHRPVEARQRGRGLDGLRHRNVREAVVAERDRLALVEVHGDDEERAGEVVEPVGAVAGAEDGLEVVADAGGLHEARRKEGEGRPEEVRQVPSLAGEGRDEGPREHARGAKGALHELDDVEAEEGRRRDAERRRRS
jgi:hypothetical protein